MRFLLTPQSHHGIDARSAQNIKTSCPLPYGFTSQLLKGAVISTGASRRFFFSFASAKESAREVEKSLFAVFHSE
jgi:hypothetical protein